MKRDRKMPPIFAQTCFSLFSFLRLSLSLCYVEKQKWNESLSRLMSEHDIIEFKWNFMITSQSFFHFHRENEKNIFISNDEKRWNRNWLKLNKDFIAVICYLINKISIDPNQSRMSRHESFTTRSNGMSNSTESHPFPFRRVESSL